MRLLCGNVLNVDFAEINPVVDVKCLFFFLTRDIRESFPTVPKKSIGHPFSIANNILIGATDIFQFQALIHTLHISTQFAPISESGLAKRKKMAKSLDSGVVHTSR
ncbi:hypothetical protein RND71_000050 [Anisodus tanguticus]|uniref:Uncharacterized protein n=1 Tax=Anisodus tanguticus TaxID=243964 RepID=A0AAE1VPP0_9SOLA|nr:hypothetical protein RND71_000050 [Anisodus tanguticus]